MDTSPGTARGIRRVRATAVLVAAGTMLLGLTACQSGAPARAAELQSVRPVVERPVGMDPELPADRMDRILTPSRVRDERYAGMTADQIDRSTLADAYAAVGRVPGCLQHVVVAAPHGADRVQCLTPGS